MMVDNVLWWTAPPAWATTPAARQAIAAHARGLVEVRKGVLYINEVPVWDQYRERT